MSEAKSQLATQALTEIEAQPDHEVTLSFVERSSLITALWAVKKLGAVVLDEKVREDYNKSPEQGENGALPIEDATFVGTRYAVEDAHEDAADIARDLSGSLRKLQRGYNLGQLSVHGSTDVSTIVAALVRSTDINPENLDQGELHHQAAAEHMLNNMQAVDSQIGNSTSFLL